MIVFGFLYNANCFESAPHTMSIHKTRKSAEIAMEFHKANVKKEYKEDYDIKNIDDDGFDYNQWWGIRETEVEELFDNDNSDDIHIYNWNLIFDEQARLGADYQLLREYLITNYMCPVKRRIN